MRLLTLPIAAARVPAELGLEVVKRVGGTALGAAKLAYEMVTGAAESPEDARYGPVPGAERPASGNGGPPPAEATAVDADAVTEVDPVADAEAAIAAREPVVEPDMEAVEPAHVSEEPEVVAEVAEQGAEEGAGAEVSLDEPWPGYDEMSAADIVDRLVAEGDAAAAAVSLYEASRKGRRTVLEAAARELRS